MILGSQSHRISKGLLSFRAQSIQALTVVQSSGNRRRFRSVAALAFGTPWLVRPANYRYSHQGECGACCLVGCAHSVRIHQIQVTRPLVSIWYTRDCFLVFRAGRERVNLQIGVTAGRYFSKQSVNSQCIQQNRLVDT